MRHANPAVSAAYALHAQRVLEQLRQRDGLAGSIREKVAGSPGKGDETMEANAKRLGMVVATEANTRRRGH